jgi:hypothetical protein
MASPRSPFREHSNGSASPRKGASFFLPDAKDFEQLHRDNDENMIGVSHSYSPSKRRDDENVIGASHSYSPSKRRDDENVTGASHSYSPSKRRNNQNASLAGFHSSGKSCSVDSSMIAAMRKEMGIIDMAVTATDADEEQKQGAAANHEVQSISSKQPPVQDPTPEDLAVLNKPAMTRLQQAQVAPTYSSDSNDPGGSIESLDKVESKPSGTIRSKVEIVKVETVNSQDAEQTLAKVEEDPSTDKPLLGVYTFDVSGDEGMTVPSEGEEGDEDVFRPLKFEALIEQNPLDETIENQSSHSFPFLTKTSGDSEDALEDPSVEKATKLETTKRDRHDAEQILGTASKESEMTETESMTESISTTSTGYETCQEDFDIVPNSSSDESGGVKKQTYISSLSKSDISSQSGIVLLASQVALAVDNEDTERKVSRPSQGLGSMQSVAAKDAQRLQNLNMQGPALSPSGMSARDRYLLAVRKSIAQCTKEYGPLSPRDRYLLAVNQAAAKCKTLAAKPQEIETVKNSTPVKNQIKLVESETFRRETSRRYEGFSSNGSLSRSRSRSSRSGCSRSESLGRSPSRSLGSSPVGRHRITRSLLATTLTKGKDEQQENDQQQEDEPFEFGSALFDDFTSAADLHANSISNAPVMHRKGEPAAFNSFNHDLKTLSSGDLPVKEQIDMGSETSPAKAYLQLDLEAAASKHTLQVDETKSAPAKSSGLGPMDTLRSSLAMIWNSKPLPNRQIDQHNGASYERASTEPLVPDASQRKSNIHPNDTREGQATPPNDQVPDSGGGAIDSMRASLTMIWNSKPRPIFKAKELQTSTLESSAKYIEVPSKKFESQEQGSPFGGDLSECTRGRSMCEVEKGPSSCTRTDEKHPREQPDGLSARQKPHRKETRAMSIQYLSSDQQRRSLSRERTITPIPSADGLYSSALLGDNWRRNNSFDSLEDLHVKTRTGTPDPYRLGSSYRSFPSGSDYRMSPNGTSSIKASPRGSKTKASPNGVACKMSPSSGSVYKASLVGSVRKSSPTESSYRDSPSSVKPATTTEFENSLTNAALKARNSNDLVVIHSETPETKEWHPPEQERREHDTMVRAILERPSLIDKPNSEPFQPRHLDWRKARKWTLVTVAMLVFAAVIVGCLACGITGKCTTRNMKDEGGEVEFQPLVLNLPEYTQESLKSMHSAQTKAYIWLENDPYRNTYSDSRKLQRFALASLFYSTRIAQNWTVSTSWLSYDVHECYWFSSYAGKDVCEGEQIKHLVLTKNNLRGSIPPELALLTQLVELDLSRNVLIGPIPEQLQALTVLEYLWLEKNELNGDIPSQIGNMTSLKSLALATNDLKGTIPSEVAALTNLQSLRLFYNFLTGTLPTEIGHLTALEVLDVDVNNLSGMIPTQLSLLKNLTELWLDWNSFVGPIPTEFGLLSNLKKLYLGSVFVGEMLRNKDWKQSGIYLIPTELGLLTNIEELYLDNNDLTGMIPTQLSALTNLQIATLDNNFLTDSISPGICSLFGVKLESLSIDCSEVICSCGCTCV